MPGINATENRTLTSATRVVSVRIIVRLRSHRSTNTPASGPTITMAAMVAAYTPLVAAGAQPA